MADFYKKNYRHVDNKTVLLACQWTRFYARKADVEQYLPTLLCMWHRESGFDPNAHGRAGEDSQGIAQTRHRYQKRLRAWWLNNHGVHITHWTIASQVALGVAEFSEHLGYAKGDLFDTVRRYNGCGKRAVRYAKNVFISRKVIYGIQKPKPKLNVCQ